EKEEVAEEKLSKLRHDKKEVIRQITRYFKTLDSSNSFDSITNSLSRIIADYTIIKNPRLFPKMINNDFRLMEEISQKKHSLYYIYKSKYLYRYRIEAYILARYFDNVEGLVRYPDGGSIFTMDENNKTALSKLMALNEAFLAILPNLTRCQF